ncbi:MAG: hypothetical protein R2798_04205 [Chitinophagales bacterium]|nr:hypothetical protein [Bacteroidota bacterium]
MKYTSYLHCLVLLLVSFFISNNIFAQSSEKPQKINYEWHEGSAVLKTGLILSGKFKYEPADLGIPSFLVEDKGINGVKKVEVPMFQSLDLQGFEPVLQSKDKQTHFVWHPEYNSLLRKVRGGEIEAYDNSMIINEKYDYIPGYKLLTTTEGVPLREMKKVSDLEDVMHKRPYFMQSAKATGKYNSRDLRVVVYLIDLYNDEDPMKVLKWDKTEISLKNGSKLVGNGYLQPLDLRNEYNTDNYAYIHFYDGKDFSLIRNDEIKQLVLNGKPYVEGFFSLTDKKFFGQPWLYNGKEYLVSRQIVNRNSYFFYNKNLTEDIVILENIAGSYRRPADEAMLRVFYLQQLKDVQGSSSF